MSETNVVPFRQAAITIGGPIDNALVSLSIYGDDLDPDELTRLLGLAPTHSHRLGDRLKPQSPPVRTGCWSHSVKRDDARGEDAADLALGGLLDRLPSEPSFWAGLGQRFQMRLFFRISFTGYNRGFGLSARNVQRAAALGVPMEFDLYAEDKISPELEALFPG